MLKHAGKLALPTALLACLAAGGPARGDGKTKAAREAAEAVVARFGGKAGAATLAAKIEQYAARHGDDMVAAVRRVGPKSFALVDAAGAHGSKAAAVLARHGEPGATWVLSRPKGMAQFLRHGDDCAAALVKHPGVAEPLVEKGGASAVKALNAVGPQSGRRLAMALDGELAGCARKPELLEVVARYGERGAKFVWDNKGALAVATALAAFLANPEPFLDGTVSLASVAADKVAAPVASGVGKAAGERVNWNLVAVGGMAAAAVFLAPLALRLWRSARKGGAP